MKRDIKSMLPSELSECFAAMGERAFRAEQTFRWLHGGARTFREMTNLPETLRERLDGEFYITAPEVLKKQISKIDGTVKYLWRLDDGNTVESVLMEYEHGLTVCISTQVGCAMGCVFCASAIDGFIRNLAAAEMLDQVMFSQMDVGRRISNVVLMGMGEPLDNFQNVLTFIRLIIHPSGMNIGARHITLSTCGIIENIDKLAEHGIQLSLAASLHAPDDETRSRLIPINKLSGVDELICACDRYYRATGRRISYEYALIDGVNDSERHAELLSQKIGKSGSHVNLIVLNGVTEHALKASPQGKVDRFAAILKERGVNYTIRRRLGLDIDAACGQLRRRNEQ